MGVYKKLGHVVCALPVCGGIRFLPFASVGVCDHLWIWQLGMVQVVPRWVHHVVVAGLAKGGLFGGVTGRLMAHLVDVTLI